MDAAMSTPVVFRRGRSRALVAAAVLVATRALAADGPLPMTVPLATTHAYLRAGPGDDFYPTERIDRGATVEVWAIDASGYCAVRPVEGSFSWMRGADVEDERTTTATPGRAPGRAGTGVVVTDGAVARVGSQLNDLRHVTQVALEAGERVRIIEEVRITEGRHAGHWLRVEPPSGEFRWARTDDLDLPPELAPPADPEQAGPPAGLAAAGEAIAAIREAGVAVAAAVKEPAAVPTADAQAAPRQLESGNGVVRLLAGWLPLGTNVFDPATATANPPPAVSAGAAAASGDELTDIDLALSLAVTGTSDTWNLPPLRERLRLAAFRATSESDRMRAQAIDARLTRFEAIQSRQRGLAANPQPEQQPLRLGGMWSSLSALGSRPVRPGVMPGGAPAGGQPSWTPPDQMETTGRLATVISRRPDAPRWALVDADNNVLAFVAPQPGVNLAPLVGQQVSVRGARGYMPEYKRPYLVASEARTRLRSSA
jgi:SH3-like domain-containing protein